MEIDRLPLSSDRVFAFWVRECRIVAVNGGVYDGRLGMLRENRELVLDLLYLDFSTIYALSWQEMVMPVSIHYALDTSRRHQFRYHKSVRRNRLGTALLLGCSDLKIAKGSREFYRIMSNETIGEAVLRGDSTKLAL